MATNMEILVEQRRQLYSLLLIKKENDRASIKVLGLERAIISAKTVMNEADVAYVEKMVADTEL